MLVPGWDARLRKTPTSGRTVYQGLGRYGELPAAALGMLSGSTTEPNLCLVARGCPKEWALLCRAPWRPGGINRLRLPTPL